MKQDNQFNNIFMSWGNKTNKLIRRKQENTSTSSRLHLSQIPTQRNKEKMNGGVLKTQKQINKFLKQQNVNTYLYRKGGSKISEISKGENIFVGNSFRLFDSGSAFLPPAVIKFFQLYNVNIKKKTSFLMEKKIRGLTRLKRMHNWCVGTRWNLKRIIITKEGVIQMADDGSVTDFLKFDGLFSMKSGSKSTHQQFGIALVSAQRKIVLKARNGMQFLSFLYYITKELNKKNHGLGFLSSSLKSNKNSIDYYVDAQQYYYHVAEGIKMAKTDIFICGWWISPQLYLRRPIREKFVKDDEHRLDNLLKSAAIKGVNIYIVVFYAPFVIPNDSDHTKRTLAALHPNIIVERHPHQILPKMWSHHQKAVIIDQKIAFMGGLDLCYGRYDNTDHPISNCDDLMYPGIDYNNVRIKDFFQVCKPQVDLQSRDLPRMPWHDVAFRVQGQIASDVANHFVEYWNFTLLQKRMLPIVNKKAQQEKERQNLEKGKNSKEVSLQGLNKNIIDKVANKQETNIQKSIQPQKQEQIFEIHNGAGQNSLLLSMEGLKLLRSENTRTKLNDELQLLRSSSKWSIGLQQGLTERSIQNAYLSAIYNAKHFIYIENQFFISATGDKDSFVANQIANALYERIERAHKNGQRFRVVVFMPLLPGMEGSLDQNCPLSLKLTMHWQYTTICRGENSLIERVKRLNNGKYKKYIQFFSLRQHGLLNDQPVTELIYIHTKLMIVDDNIVICGSANINDRSQNGDRDSELAVIFTEGEKVSRKMNGVETKVNKKAHELRVRLYQEHFGLKKQYLEDPILLQNLQVMGRVAKNNTEIYREVFGCSPDDTAATFDEVKKLEKILNEAQKQKYKSKKNQICGQVVEFPMKFLEGQNLKTLGLDKVQDIFT